MKHKESAIIDGLFISVWSRDDARNDPGSAACQAFL